MRCPKCSQDNDKVIDSRSLHNGEVVRRRRTCVACGHRFTTYERVSMPSLIVLKRDQRREPFHWEKLKNSILHAVAKRPVSLPQVEMMATDIQHEIESEHGADALVPSNVIGRKVLDKLEKVDEVAYLRYASIYRRFRDASQFLSEIDTLIGRQQ